MLKNTRKIKILDANAVLRYVINDIPEQAEIVKRILRSCKVLILPEVIMEIVFVMYKFYKIPRTEIAKELFNFLTEIRCDNIILINAVKNFGVLNLDFIDCLLLEYSQENQYEVFTFDEKLIKTIQKLRGQND